MHEPGRGVWAAWGLALLGGIAVLAAAIGVLTDPCTDGGPCSATRLGWITPLTVTGTVLAVGGAVVATALTVRRKAVQRRFPTSS